MFYVLNLSKSRRYVQNKYNDIVIDFKLNPPKINKTLIIGSIGLGMVLFTRVVVHAKGSMDQTEYKHVIDYLVSERHYPRDVAEKIVGNFNNSDFQELWQNIQSAKDLDNSIDILVQLATHPIQLAKHSFQNYIQVTIDAFITK